MSKLSCDIKYMYRASTGYKFILVVKGEVTNYLVTITLYRGISYKFRDTLINHIFCKCDPLVIKYFIYTKNLLSTVMQYIYK